jgi:hypothetical protein
MFEFTEDLILHLTKYLNISDYRNIILLNKNTRNILSKYENYVWNNIINGTKNCKITKRGNYYNIEITQNIDKPDSIKKKYCFTFPEKMSIKKSLQRFCNNNNLIL